MADGRQWVWTRGEKPAATSDGWLHVSDGSEAVARMVRVVQGLETRVAEERDWFGEFLVRKFGKDLWIYLTGQTPENVHAFLHDCKVARYRQAGVAMLGGRGGCARGCGRML